MTARRQLMLSLALALAGVSAGVAVQQYFGGDAAAPQQADLRAATLLGTPRPLPEFALQGGDGREFTRESLRGRWTVLFFGFTNCPDVCPMTMATLADAMQRLEAEAAPRPAVVFVSVDPQRDSAEAAARYAGHFDAAFAAATGPEDALRELTLPIGILHKAFAADGGENYTVDHSTALLLVDPEARLRAVFSAPHVAAVLAADLAALVSG